MSCGFHCHEVGGPYIAENPDCPIHGADGIGKDLDQMDDMRQVISELCTMLEGYADPEHLQADELIQRARAFL